MNTVIKFLLAMLISLTHGVYATDYSDPSKYGNKTANLARVQKIIDGLRKQQNVPVRVPLFMGLGHDEVKEHLVKMAHYKEIERAWGEFALHQGHKTELIDAGRAELAAIRKAIGEGMHGDFTIYDKERAADLGRFLADAKSDSLRLMVRSTGKEDSKELANAGGNESIANVEPDIASITKAMDKVLQSYFGEKSFKQRITAGEDPKTLFSEPFLPVLLQVMVGEKDGQIPTSGVAFSRETLGNTPGVVSIDATFGHGEAVVNSIYPADTFYIGPNDLIHPIIRIKHTRLIPKTGAREHGLMPMANDFLDQRRSSLTATQIGHIVKVARTLEDELGYAVDIEFVALGDYIYIVQVRPIVEAANKPSYLTEDFVKNIRAENQVAMSPIVSGGGEMKQIHFEDQVIVADRIGKALDIYLDMQKTEQEKILLIISGENAPQTSHEATTFRSNNKPVMYVRDIAKAQAIIASEHHRLADVQRGSLYQADAFNEHADLNRGWLKHPIAEMVSIHPEFFPRDTIAHRFDDPTLADVPISGLMDMARQSTDFAQARSAIYTLRERLLTRINVEEKRQIELTSAKAETNPRLLPQLRTLYRHIKYASNEVLWALETYFAKKGEKTETDELLRLYPINFLSALISQVPMDPDVVNPYSFGYLLKTERQESLLVQALEQVKKDDRGYVVQYARLGQYALTDEVAGAWGDLLKRFDQVSDKQAFAQMMVTLAKLDILPIWLNMVFYPAFTEKSDPEELSQKLINTLNDERELLDGVFSLHQRMRQFPLTQLRSPKKFGKTLAGWQEQVVNQTLDTDFLEKIAKGSVMAKLVGLSALNYFVSKFDEGIKSLTGSQEYSSQTEKAANFGAVLDQYFQVLEVLSQKLLGDSEARSLLARPDIISGVDNYKSVALPQGMASYLKRMKTLMVERAEHATTTEEDAKKAFQPSPTFSVNAAKLGSEARWNLVVTPYTTTLEDLFTLTHQNLLVILAKASAGLPWHSLPMPLLVKTLKEAMEQSDMRDKGQKLPPPALIGATLNKDGLTLYFNQTLRSHSNTFEIAYNLANRGIILKTQFLGQTQQRWHYFALLVKDILPITADLPTASLPFVDAKRHLLTFSWHIQNESQAHKAAHMWQYLGNLSNTIGTTLSKHHIASFFEDVKTDLDAEKIGAICKKQLLNPWTISNEFNQATMMEVLVEKYPESCRAATAPSDVLGQAVKVVEGLVLKKRLDDALTVVYAYNLLLDPGQSFINFLDRDIAGTLENHIKDILMGDARQSKLYWSSISQQGKIMTILVSRSKSLIDILLQKIDPKYIIKENLASDLIDLLNKGLTTSLGEAVTEKDIDLFVSRFIGNPLPKGEERSRTFGVLTHFISRIIESGNQRLVNSLKHILMDPKRLMDPKLLDDSLKFMLTYFNANRYQFSDDFNIMLIDLMTSRKDEMKKNDLSELIDMIKEILQQDEEDYKENSEALTKYKAILQEKVKLLTPPKEKKKPGEVFFL